jgi:predicted TIM-barrel fold metal-dependent hydrolase
MAMDSAAVEPFAIDADGHVIEPNEAWQAYLPAIYRDRAPHYRANAEGKFRDRLPVGRPPGALHARRRHRHRVHARLQRLAGRLVRRIPRPAAAGRPHHPARHSLGDRGNGARREGEGRRRRRDPTQPGAGPQPRRSRHPAYDPFYATVQDFGLPLIIHESTGCPQTLGADRYGIANPAAYTFNHVVSHSMEQMFAALSVICGGVLEKFPRLKVGFFEAGCSWAPYWLGRLDSHFEHRSMRKQMPLLTMKPSEYFARQCAVTCDPDDDTIPLAIQGIGADHILFASDYPHFDSGAGPVREFLAKDGIAPEDQSRILRDNAIAFFGIEIAAPLAGSASVQDRQVRGSN